MALCPFAMPRLLPESHTQPKIAPRAVILHSAAGEGSLYQFFLTGSNLESHFWVGSDGRIEQYVDTEVRADANLNANSFAVSIETESTVAATERWSDPQAASIVRLVEWLCDTHPAIARRQIDSPTGSGIGWHIMFGAPGPWTPHHKTCPGPARIVQARDEIIPAIVASDPHNPYPKPDPTPKDPLMALTDKQANQLVQDAHDAKQAADGALQATVIVEATLAAICNHLGIPVPGKP